MGSFSQLSRRGLVKWGLLSAGIPALSKVLGSTALAQDAGPMGGTVGEVGGRSQEELYPAKGLPGGGQLEIRMTQSIYTSDPDELEVAQRMKPFDMESWITEWVRVAEKNEQIAEKYDGEGLKVSAAGYYQRASHFYRLAAWPQPVTEPRMLPTYKKMRQMFDKGWSLVRPPFERVKVNWEGKTLDGYFRKPGGQPGKKFPTVIAYEGADTMAESTIMGIASPFVARGMAFLALDFPGQGGALRLQDLHMPPDAERITKVMIDYVQTRPDVDANRIGMVGISMGGYGTPRSASEDKRLKAVCMMSGSYCLQPDLFDYFPPIQERVRWIIGAKDLFTARKQLADYTLEGRAQKIECPMLVGYSKDDRIMDPRGAHQLYEAAVNSKRNMVEGTGHNQASNAGGPREMRTPVFPDFLMKELMA